MEDKSGKKAKKDPNKPKRPASAYFLWLNDHRQALAKECKKPTEVTKLGAERWKAVSGSERKTYEDQAAALKKKHEAAMAEYRKSKGGDAGDDDDDDDDENE